MFYKLTWLSNNMRLLALESDLQVSTMVENIEKCQKGE
jgi:hypothetical protein